MEQCLTISRSKTPQKKTGARIWASWGKIRPKISFFAIFSSLAHFAKDDNLEYCLTTSSGKTLEKNLVAPNWVQN